MHFEVVHELPGRVRIRVRGLAHDQPLADALCHWLKCECRAEGTRANIYCSSVVILFDRTDSQLFRELGEHLRLVTRETLLAAFPGHAKSEDGPPRKGPLHSKKAMAWSMLAIGLALIPYPLGPLAAIPLTIMSAIPIWRRAWNVIWKQRRLNVDVLDSVAVMICLGRGQIATGAFITWMIGLGDWIRDLTAAKSKRAMADLLDFRDASAWVLRSRKVVRIRALEVKPGQTVIVYPGEIVPVDGEIIRGTATLDQKNVTGESIPAERGPGEMVFASTVVRQGKLSVRATRVGNDTTAAQIVRMVETAPVGETRIQNYAEHFADRLVAPAMLLSGGLYALSGDVNRLLSMMIVDFGTGIRVAAPTSVLSGMVYAASQGILIKGGNHMEQLAQVDTIVFDKTGTLTQGSPQILDVVSFSNRRFPAAKIIGLAAAAEARLTHPVAEAIVSKARREHIPIPERIDSNFQIGLGVEARVNGYSIHIGNHRFFREKKICHEASSGQVRDFNAQGCSSLLFAVDGKLTGLIPYADPIRPESRDVVRTLQNRGLRNIVMLTGDNAAVAAGVARQLGIEKYVAGALPDDKARVVSEYRKAGRVVAMVGDGINDSPALAFANVGISLKNAADVARETADVILMDDNLWKLIAAIDISKDTIALIHQNYGIIVGLNALALLLAIPRGLVSPNISALISNGSAILASLNAVRPMMSA
jgi:cation-transporting P-type ATPase C